jgi:hypothetical protein
MRRTRIVGLLKNRFGKSNAEEAEIESLLARAEAIKDNADEVLAGFVEDDVIVA